MSSVPETIPPSLWTKVCPNCAYSLEGGPTIGICPECGRANDQSEIFLHGYARGGHENVTNAKTSRLAWVVLLSLLWTAQFFGSSIGSYLWALGFAVLSALYFLLRRKGSSHPGLVQVRLSSQGCVQYDDLAGPSVLRDLTVSNFWLLPLAALFGLVAGRQWGLVDAFEFWCFFAISLAALPFCWASSRRYRIAVRHLREGSIADLNAAVVKPTPWNHTSGFKLKKSAKDRYRFRVDADYKFLVTFTFNPIDAEITASDEQIRELEELIRQWRSIA